MNLTEDEIHTIAAIIYFWLYAIGQNIKLDPVTKSALDKFGVKYE